MCPLFLPCTHRLCAPDMICVQLKNATRADDLLLFGPLPPHTTLDELKTMANFCLGQMRFVFVGRTRQVPV